MKVIVNGRNFEDLPPEEQARWREKWAKRAQEMLDSRSPPRVSTDDTFRAAYGANGRQFEGDPDAGDWYRRRAEAAGQSTTGKVYLHALAEYPGDPRAWVDGKGDVARVCEERGWDCDGAVRVKGREFDHKPGPAVAEDIVQGEVAERMAEDPGQRAEDVREQVIAERKPHWAK